MKFTLRSLCSFALVIICMTNLEAKHMWVDNFESLIKKQERKFLTSGLRLNSHENYDYWKLQNPIYNGIATGNTKSDIPSSEYVTVLLAIWHNTYKLELLEDYGIKLQSLRWYLNQQNKCVDTSHIKNDAREFLREIEGKSEHYKIDSLFIWSLLGEKQDVEYLMEQINGDVNSKIARVVFDALELAKNRKLVVSELIELQGKFPDEESRQRINHVIQKISSFSDFTHGACSFGENGKLL